MLLCASLALVNSVITKTLTSMEKENCSSLAESWNTDDLCDQVYARLDDSERIILSLRENKITGKTFLNLKSDDLKELFPLMGDRLEMSLMIESLTKESQV